MNRTSASAFACIVLGAVSCGHPDRAVEENRQSPIGNASAFFLATICRQPDSSQDMRSKWIPAVDPGRAEGREMVCVDLARTIQLREDLFRMFVVGESENYIELSCTHPASTIGGLPPGQGELALVADNKVMSTFRYLDFSEVVRSCGLVPISDLNVAVDTCEDVRSMLNGDTASCTKVCDAEVQSELDKVCIVINGAPPGLTK
jgi:hypothetical protein